MKVLFAVNDENISTSIVKKYQKNYKEIISYKNVYYFNAILKELQRNKSYDRIVISEDLEEFTSSSYAQKDKFIFDRLDNISDEAVTTTGNDIPIILICSERRKKSEEILVKLFGIGVYNAIIGEDRSTDEVCRLINKPRAKKDAKVYYEIDSEKVSYEKESEKDVSEMEMQNILVHFKKLGNQEEKYEESFNNIASQYNDDQMKVIIAILPENVKDVLQERSDEYLRLTGKARKVRSTNTNSRKTSTRSLGSKKGTVEKLLDVEENKIRLTKPVVVPTTMEKNLYKKVSTKKPVEVDIEELEEDPIKEPKPKRRGRPRKEQVMEETPQEEKPKRRGRPKKAVQEEIKIENKAVSLPGFEEENDYSKEEFENINYKPKKLEQAPSILPGFDEDYEEDEEEDYDIEENYTTREVEPTENRMREYHNSVVSYGDSNNQYDNIIDDAELESLLSSNKKIAAFVGTSKNGTSFIVNNVAQILSGMGVNTAILDATQNKNSYYIYTKNDEELRRTAVNCLENLKNSTANGIKVNNNLTVYTTIPNQNDTIKNSRPIIQTLLKNHSVVLIDCDFNTPIEYFSKSQEIYLIQSMDVLTIQALTAFLRDLKAKDALEERKIRIVLNKLLKIRGVSEKNIIGGMSNYNDPEMSFMTELFDRNLVKVAAQIPFDEDVYAKYLEGLIQCEIKLNGYPKEFKQKLNNLADVVFSVSSNSGSQRKGRKDKELYSNSFSAGMNNTLENMRKNY